jgi:hypothetical protein
MCGRIIQSSGPLRLAIIEGLDVSDSRLGNIPRRYNAAPSQELLVIRQRSGKESWPRPTSRLSSRRYGGGKATLLMASTIDATHLLLDLGLFGAAMSGVWN